MGQPGLAERLYHQCVIGDSIVPELLRENKRMLEVYQRDREGEARPDTSMINCLCGSKNVEEAMRFLEQMKRWATFASHGII